MLANVSAMSSAPKKEWFSGLLQAKIFVLLNFISPNSFGDPVNIQLLLDFCPNPALLIAIVVGCVFFNQLPPSLRSLFSLSITSRKENCDGG